MGCLSRIGCAVVVVTVGGAAWWLYGDQLPTQLTRVTKWTANAIGNATSSTSDSISAKPVLRDSAQIARETRAWASVTSSANSTNSTVKNPIAALSQRNGPAFVTLGVGDLAALLAAEFLPQLPESTANVAIAMDGKNIYVRSVIDANEIAGDGTLGRMLGIAMSGKDTVELAGPLQYVQPKVAQFTVEQLRVKGVEVPPRLIPMFMRALRRGPRHDGVADNALFLPLPLSVADLRVANGKLILYKAAPAP